MADAAIIAKRCVPQYRLAGHGPCLMGVHRQGVILVTSGRRDRRALGVARAGGGMTKTYVEPHMAESLAGHVLEAHVDTPDLKGWYLKRPGSGRMMSTLILSTREGLVILGDLCPKQNGVISCYGYDWHWFAGKKSEDYLCEKFLQREFVLEEAIEDLRRAIVEGRRQGHITKDDARYAIGRIEGGEAEGMESVADIYHDAGLSDISESVRYCYNPGDAGWLCAIQQRFAQLMQEQLAEVAA